MTPACLSVAGFDPSGGAGVLADVATFSSLGCRAAALVTAVTAQNRRRVEAVHPLAASWFRQQSEAVLANWTPDAVKIGMLANARLVREVAVLLDRLDGVPVVLDPVLAASSGAALIDEGGIRAVRAQLLPRVRVITPNVREAAVLLESRIRGEAGMVRAAERLRALGPAAVVITGGDRRGDPIDVLCDERGTLVMRGRRCESHNTRGTGCRHSAALAALLAYGHTLRTAARKARAFVRAHLAG